MVKYIPDKLKPTDIIVRNYTGDGSTVNFTVTSGMTVNKVIVTNNGVLQRPTTDYTITATSLSFTVTPTASENIQIIEMPV